MRKFSWYTIIHPDWQPGEPPLFRLVGPAILPDERTCDIYFKPNRKGGYNRKESHLFNIESKRIYGHVWPIVKKDLKHSFFKPERKRRKKRFLKRGSVLIFENGGGIKFIEGMDK